MTLFKSRLSTCLSTRLSTCLSTLLFITFFTTSVSCQVNMQKQNADTQLNSQENSQSKALMQPSLTKEGFWVSLETGQVVEVLVNGNLILNRFGSLDDELIDATHYTSEMDTQNQLVITLNNDAVEIFQRPALIDASQLTGQWFLYSNDGDYENSQLLTYQAEGYQFESVELFHDDQSYSKYSEFLPYRFSNGFVFEDYFVDGESYWYFLVESTDEFKTYIDEDGSLWTEEKYTDQPHVVVPSGYFNESF